MKPEFWHGIWSKGLIGFHQHDFNKHMQSYTKSLGVKPGGNIFVPLCGKSLDMLWLSEQGYRVTGVEISKQAIEEFFAENKLSFEMTRVDGAQLYCVENIAIYCGDFFNVNTPKINAVYDRASLIALPLAMRSDYVNRLTSMIATGTRSLLVTLDYPEHQMSGPPFSVTPAEVESLYAARYKIEHIHSEDFLSKETRFQKLGLTRLDEHVFLLEKKQQTN